MCALPQMARLMQLSVADNTEKVQRLVREFSPVTDYLCVKARCHCNHHALIPFCASQEMVELALIVVNSGVGIVALLVLR